jgi:hypothetical protein
MISSHLHHYKATRDAFWAKPMKVAVNKLKFDPVLGVGI